MERAMQKLTTAQKKAMEKLTYKWASSYTLGVGRNTLDALRRKGLVERVVEEGAQFAPSSNIKYRLKADGLRERDYAELHRVHR